MKKLTVEYQGYKLDITIHYNYQSAKGNYYIISTCDELDSFVKRGYYENCSPIIEEFMKYADHVIEIEIENKKKKDESKKEESAELKGLRKHCIRLSSLNLDPRALVIELNGIYELYGKVLGISLEEIKRAYFVLAENPKADLSIQVK